MGNLTCINCDDCSSEVTTVIHPRTMESEDMCSVCYEQALVRTDMDDLEEDDL